MYDKDLYAKILFIESPWVVSGVNLKLSEGQIEVEVSRDSTAKNVCSLCNTQSPKYDEVERRWRHLDTCQYKTIIVSRVPRVQCSEHGVQQVSVPWSEKGSRLTSLFERLIIDWLKEASTLAVSTRLRLSWKQVDGVMQRAVRRGLLRREQQLPKRIGIDETSFQKRHEYVTVITDMVAGKVIDVVDDRKKAPLEESLKKLGEKALSELECVAMDMHQPFIQAVRSVVPEAGKKIAFDKFHVIAHLTKAVNQVRRQENADLIEQGNESLKGTRFLWITGKENLSLKQEISFQQIKDIAIRTSQAWMFKECARGLWSFSSRRVALKAWRKWCEDASSSELLPIQKAAAMVLNHLQGILVAISLNATNARGEAMNNKIQHLKKVAYGFRNRKRFKNAIFFHLGGLDLYPI
jgi:transposase